MSGSRSVATRTLVGLALILVAAWTSSADRSGAAAIQCVDVAEARGLTFRGAYGSVVEDRDQMARMMERNMGNGVAVGEIDGRRQRLIDPPGAGFVRLTVQDAAGAADTVVVRIQ